MSSSGASVPELGDLGLERRAQPVDQVRPELVLGRGLGRPARRVEGLVAVVGIDAEERERAAVLGRRLGDAALVLEDQDPLAVVHREHALELRRVAAALGRVRADRLHPRVGAAARAVRDARPVALDRIAEHDQQLRVGRGAADQRRDPEVVHVARRPLAGDLARAARELLVVARDPRVGELAVANWSKKCCSLRPLRGPRICGMVEQRLEPPRGARALGADADEVGRSGRGLTRRHRAGESSGGRSPAPRPPRSPCRPDGAGARGAPRAPR